jgi:hypothetical protein
VFFQDIHTLPPQHPIGLGSAVGFTFQRKRDKIELFFMPQYSCDFGSKKVFFTEILKTSLVTT